MYIYVLCAHKYKKYNIAMYVYIYIHIYIYVYNMYLYIYIYTYICVKNINRLMLRDPIFAGLSTMKNPCVLNLTPWPRGTFASMRSISAPRSLKNETLGSKDQTSWVILQGLGIPSFIYTYIYMIMYIYIYAQGRVKSGWYWSVHTPKTFLSGHTYIYTRLFSM